MGKMSKKDQKFLKTQIEILVDIVAKGELDETTFIGLTRRQAIIKIANTIKKSFVEES